MAEVSETLAQRRGTHGPYAENTELVQKLKEIFRASPAWNDMEPHQRESLDMIAHKLARICTGDPHFHDHWHDIGGYAKLTADLLVKS